MVALSTTEAELIELSEAARECVWLRRLLSELGEDMSEPTVLFEDNNGARAIAGQPKNIRKIRHLRVRDCFVQGKVEDKTVEIKSCGSKDMVADIFTKPIRGRIDFERLRCKLGVVPHPQ